MQVQHLFFLYFTSDFEIKSNTEDPFDEPHQLLSWFGL